MPKNHATSANNPALAASSAAPPKKNAKGKEKPSREPRKAAILAALRGTKSGKGLTRNEIASATKSDYFTGSTARILEKEGLVGVERLAEERVFRYYLTEKGAKDPRVKESRFSIRVDPMRKAVIARAAKQNGATISDFVVENAYQMATELLADEGTISLNKKQVAHIFEVLDRPPATSIAAVRKLLTERSILDG
jgi:uncharacterized protein (DUF1778 family)